MNLSYSNANNLHGGTREGAQDRILVLCVGASMLVHAMLLALFPELRQGAREPAQRTVLTARIEKVFETPVTPHEVKPARIEPPKPQPKVQQETPVPQTPPTVVSAPPVALPPVSSSPAATTPVPPPATARQGDNNDAINLDQYSVAVKAAARKMQRYPALAYERGWTGRVEVRITLGANGAPNVQVKTASGFEVLDRNAVDLVTRAIGATPLPPVLRGKDFVLDIPVDYILRAS